MRKGLNAFQLKVIAIIGMTLDHVANTFMNQLPMNARLPMFFVGGFTFPIMGFLLVEGFSKTRNRKKYALRLFLWALVAQYPYTIALHTRQLNVLFTLLVCLGVLVAREKLTNDLAFFAVLIGTAALTLFFFDWGGIGVMLVFFYRSIAHPKRRIWMPIVGMSACMILGPLFALLVQGTSLQVVALNTAFFLGCLPVIPMLFHYNGERGRPLKTFFYAYYPAHLAVLALMYTYLIH